MAQPPFDESSRMLAQANLHRMRGQWDEAIAICMDAMRLMPNDPTAHSLLGDIYSDQGNLDEAIRWYCMALDLKPASRADREKLSRLVESKRQALIAADQKDPHTTLRLRRRYGLLAERTGLRHGRVWKADKAVRNGVVAAFVIMVLVILSAPIVNYERKKQQDSLGAIALTGRQINVAPVYYLPLNKGTSYQSLASAGPTTFRDPFDQKIVDNLL
ncbi:MAG TPA: tetratricopeptide repeat protein, partial [Capsulimonadaceae bacterium]|nr:tetratricopeptide repeat protein [Capsulimonadaceae bacterium]